MSSSLIINVDEDDELIKAQQELDNMQKSFKQDLTIAIGVVLIALIITLVVKNYINRKYRRDFENDQIKAKKLQMELLKKYPDL